MIHLKPLGLAFVLSGLASFATMANTGTIDFTGSITSNTCQTSVNGGSAVNLPPVSVGALNTAASKAGRTNFNIELTGCTGTLTTASAFFEAGAGVDTNGRLINTGTATDVALQLLDGSNSNAVIEAGNSNQINSTSYVPLGTGAVSLPYAVEYYALGSGAGAGSVTSAVTYNIQYK